MLVIPNAGLMAKMGQTLDDLSGGRLILGLGCGWHRPEYAAFGIPFDHLVGRFEEDLEVIHRLLDGEKVDFEGKWSRYKGRPAAAPARPPDAHPRGVEGRADAPPDGEVGDAWNTAWFGAVDETVRQRIADLDAACDAVGAEAGRDPPDVGIRVFDPGERGDDARSTDADAPVSPICSTSSRRSAQRRDHLVDQQVAVRDRPDR